MNKTVNINLASTPFILDEDAYMMLREYLSTISKIYGKSIDGDELVGDIEARMAELFAEALVGSGRSIVIRPDVELAINQIGRPQDFDQTEIEIDRTAPADDTEDIQVLVEEQPAATPPPFGNNDAGEQQRTTRQLFRNPRNKRIAGVCSGIAAYIGVDPTWVRLLTVALCFLSFSTLAICYIVLWLVVPEANTPEQQMKMYGKSPTFDNIGRTVTNMFGDSDKASGSDSFSTTLTNIAVVIAKVVMVLILLAVVPVLLIILGVVIFSLVAVILYSCTGSDISPIDVPINSIYSIAGIIALIGTLISFGIPMTLIAVNLFSKKSFPSSSKWRTTLLTAWIIGLIMATAGWSVAKRGQILERIEEAVEYRSSDATDTKISEEGIDVSKGNKRVRITNDSISITKGGKKVAISVDNGKDATTKTDSVTK